MRCLSPDSPLARDVVRAIQAGDLAGLQRLLTEHPDLATARIGDPSSAAITRTLLHVTTDWPGHFPNGAAIVGMLAAAGADVNAAFTGPHAETPLHWAASSNDVAVLDALLDAGADIEAPGAVLGGGPPLADAAGFRQWAAAHRLVARGARVTLRDAATLGLQDRVEQFLANGATAPTEAEINGAFWWACHGGQASTAAYLLDRGADVNWLPHWEDATPLDAAEGAKASALAAWLRGHGARRDRERRAHRLTEEE
jgi:ankyrin repeat protein